MERYHQRPLENRPDTFEWLFDQRSQLHVCDFEGLSRPGQCYSEHECNLFEAELRKHASKVQTWLKTSNHIFWVSGKAGSGKSTLMKFLFEHQQTRLDLRYWAGGDVIVAAFFCWRAGSSELEKSYLGLLRGLLYQVLHERPEMIELVLPQRWQLVIRSAMCKKPWTKEELVTAFDKLLQAPETSSRFCFFVDGLRIRRGSPRSHRCYPIIEHISNHQSLCLQQALGLIPKRIRSERPLPYCTSYAHQARYRQVRCYQTGDSTASV